MAWLQGSLAALLSVLVASGLTDDPEVVRSAHRSVKKSAAATAEAVPALATLSQIHTGDRVVLAEAEPTQDRFAALLADRVTGERIALDARLLELLRSVARRHPGARIELVSGYRSAKLNEAMRKKGRHVASHSQHSLGHAVDFRVVELGGTSDDERRLDPRALEAEIRSLGWAGGVGTYPSKADGFVHADVGPRRRWNGT